MKMKAGLIQAASHLENARPIRSMCSPGAGAATVSNLGRPERGGKCEYDHDITRKIYLSHVFPLFIF
jgi:hypothetical protein